MMKVCERFLKCSNKHSVVFFFNKLQHEWNSKEKQTENWDSPIEIY